MMLTSLKRMIFSTIVVCMGLVAAAGSAQAVVPEIKVDPATGLAQPHPDLAIALAEIEADIQLTKVADIRWRRAPWYAS